MIEKVDKKKLLEKLLQTLEATYQVAFNAAQRAHETATADENVAENKYDTLAVEAAYLAQGQSVRVEQCDADIEAFKALPSNTSSKHAEVGSLVILVDQNDVERYLFLGPTAGGVKVSIDGIEVVVITLSSPLGKAVHMKEADDEVSLVIADRTYHYEVSALL